MARSPCSRRVLGAESFQSRDTVAIARSLLGKLLVRSGPGGTKESVICEVEAYDGETDLACHASRGRTARTEVMYRQGGIWYVYLIYGIHSMVNLVTGPRDYPAAVLIRSIASVKGPGRLTRAWGIDRSLNGLPAEPASGLHIVDVGIVVPDSRVQAGPRVGIDFAGKEWASKPWRFVLKEA